MRLSILVAALEGRPYAELVRYLQAQAHGLPVEVLWELDRGQTSSGSKRQTLVNRATGDYLAFIDDDDWVSDTYVLDLLDGIERNPDVVTFNLSLNRELWKFGIYRDSRRQGLMAANHLCAWRSELARSVGWCPYLGYGDDQLWYKPLLASGKARIARHVDKTLYEYRYSQVGTANQTGPRLRYSRSYARFGLGCYKTLQGDIVVEVGNANHPAMGVHCIDPRGVERVYPRNELDHFATVDIT